MREKVNQFYQKNKEVIKTAGKSAVVTTAVMGLISTAILAKLVSALDKAMDDKK
jgi:hypothetical protein